MTDKTSDLQICWKSLFLSVQVIETWNAL